MSDWLLGQRYGFGAARVRLRPEPSCSQPPASLRQGLRDWASELRAQGWLRNARNAAALAPALALGLALLLALGAILARNEAGDSSIQVVMLRSQPEATLEPESALPLPPPPAVTPPAPLPKPQEPAAAPQQARPEPPPPPQPPVQVPRMRRPPIQIDGVARAPEKSPAARPDAPRRRPSPVAASRPSFRIDPVAKQTDPAQPERVAARPVRQEASRRPAPRIEHVSPVAAPAAPAPRVPPAVSTRPPARTRTVANRQRPSPRALAPSGLALPGLHETASTVDPAERAAGVSRAGTRIPSPAPGGASGSARRASHDPGIRGVALGSLASCVSDRKENDLKQQVVASVGARHECTNDSGHYRFVETKNLNAFLMWIERDPSRRQADRCMELALALECLKQQYGRRSREG